MSGRIIEIEQDVREVLCGIEWDEDTAKLTSGKLSRPLYVRVNKVLESLGGKWDRKSQGHIFSRDSAEDLEDIIEQGFYTKGGIKNHLQQFFTPDNIADIVVEKAELKDGMSILEPSAGNGSLLRAVTRRFDNSAGLKISAVEIDPILTELLPDVGLSLYIANADFMQWEKNEHYPTYFDRVLMNPPFTKQQDIRHVQRAFEMLDVGGRLVAITSPGWKFRTNKLSLNFKDFVAEYGWSEPLPEGAFKQSGTGVNTEIIVLNRA